MNQNQFKAYLLVAEGLNNDYSRGYQRGLRRHYHGDSFGTDAEHDQYYTMIGHRQEIGDGYRDGFAGKPPKGFHGNIGNTHAAGELPADSKLQCRVNSRVKAGYVKQAQSEGLKLSEWILKTLDAEIARNE